MALLSLRRRPSRVARRYTNGGLLLNRAASANGKPAEGTDTTDAGDKDIIVVIEGAQQAAAATGPDGEIAGIKRCRGDSDPSNAIVHRRDEIADFCVGRAVETCSHSQSICVASKKDDRSQSHF